MVIIYSSVISKRLEYIVRQIFHQILGTEFQITTDRDFFLYSTDCCVNYSETDLNKGLWIYPHAILFEEDIHPQNIEVIKQSNKTPFFFQQEKGKFPFDIFAASFYLLSRYEEYYLNEKDPYGRFKAENSLAFREGFLQIPVVDRWAYQLKDFLQKENNESIVFSLRQPRLITTFDIDHPFLYRNKGLIKNITGAFNDIKKQDWIRFKERICVFFHLKEDPYFAALKNIVELHKKYDRDYFLFVHVGKYGKFDKRTIYPLRRYYQYLRSLNNTRFGLHPSFQASFNQQLIDREKLKLEKILKIGIKRNRQHFLRMQIPETYEILDRLHFSEDFTLVYASQPGFRGGTAIPFYHFDLETNDQRPLLIRPTIIMDGTLKTYLKLSPEEAIETINRLANECKLSGGDFCILWHNSTIDHSEENPWYQVFIHSFLTGISLEK